MYVPIKHRTWWWELWDTEVKITENTKLMTDYQQNLQLHKLSSSESIWTFPSETKYQQACYYGNMTSKYLSISDRIFSLMWSFQVCTYLARYSKKDIVIKQNPGWPLVTLKMCPVWISLSGTRTDPQVLKGAFLLQDYNFTSCSSFNINITRTIHFKFWIGTIHFKSWIGDTFFLNPF